MPDCFQLVIAAEMQARSDAVKVPPTATDLPVLDSAFKLQLCSKNLTDLDSSHAPLTLLVACREHIMEDAKQAADRVLSSKDSEIAANVDQRVYDALKQHYTQG